MAQIPTTAENKQKINDFVNHIADQMANLYSRWLDEKEYEDFNDYVAVFKKMLPEGFTFISASKRPFGFNFSIGTEAVYQFSVNSSSVGWKRVKDQVK